MGLLDRIKKLSAPTDKKTPHVKKLPDFTPKWDREWVIPDNDLQTADIDAGLLVDSKRPTDADPVPVTVETADPLADLVQVPDCELRKKKLVDGAGKKPVVRFTLKDHRIWQPFDKLEYHFTATVDATSKRTDKPIKVKRFHVHALNTHERPAILAIRQEEGANHTGAFSGSQDDVMHRKEFNAEGCAFTDFGGWMRNTYSYMYTGHGGVVCGVCGQMYNCTTAPGPTFGDWIDCRGDSSHNDPRSTHCIGPAPWNNGTWFRAEDVLDTSKVPEAPKYLMFSVCCGGAHEPSLGDAYRSRGTRYVILFRKSTRCTLARDYEKSFFDTWVKTHKCDPEKIPEIFDGLLSQYDMSLKPVLFGRKPPVPPKPKPTVQAPPIPPKPLPKPPPIPPKPTVDVPPLPEIKPPPPPLPPKPNVQMVGRVKVMF